MISIIICLNEICSLYLKLQIAASCYAMNYLFFVCVRVCVGWGWGGGGGGMCLFCLKNDLDNVSLK